MPEAVAMLPARTTTKEAWMFRELTQELLDLRVTEKGYGLALYAAEEDGGGGTCSSSCSSSTLCVSLCCTI
jgi:hypothetical protein